MILYLFENSGETRNDTSYYETYEILCIVVIIFIFQWLRILILLKWIIINEKLATFLFINIIIEIVYSFYIPSSLKYVRPDYLWIIQSFYYVGFKINRYHMICHTFCLTIVLF